MNNEENKESLNEVSKVSNVVTETKDNVIVLDENYNDIFITEKNRFTVSVEYYKDEGNNIIVENVDDNFDKTRKTKKISVTFKYPNQGDVTAIANNPIRSNVKSMENLTVNDFILLEISRFMCLIREWSLPQKINNETIMNINPKIIKGILSGIRKEIGTEGII